MAADRGSSRSNPVVSISSPGGDEADPSPSQSVEVIYYEHMVPLKKSEGADEEFSQGASENQSINILA